ncbi:hypothetical protein [Streptomyces sp. NPDC046985]|uniref:hypothetical protein n=1 Tax=Streptomyces sp. NPDC046985 TaxID=3155377 RepID=UPI00340B0BC1
MGSQSASDAAASPHRDLHAVASAARTSSPLVRGAAVGADPAGARDAGRDVPFFPG